MGVFNFQNSNYGLFISMKNCSFYFNSAQFGGVFAMVQNSETQMTINITNSIFLANNASKINIYLGLDYSQGGMFIAINNQNATIYLSNLFVSSSFARKGSFSKEKKNNNKKHLGGIFVMIGGFIQIYKVIFLG